MYAAADSLSGAERCRATVYTLTCVVPPLPEGFGMRCLFRMLFRCNDVFRNLTLILSLCVLPVSLNPHLHISQNVDNASSRAKLVVMR